MQLQKPLAPFCPSSFFFSFFFKGKLPILSLESATDQRTFVIITFHGNFFLISNFINSIQVSFQKKFALHYENKFTYFCIYSLNLSLEFFIMIFFVINQLNIGKFLPPQIRKTLISYYLIETKLHQLVDFFSQCFIFDLCDMY